MDVSLAYVLVLVVHSMMVQCIILGSRYAWAESGGAKTAESFTTRALSHFEANITISIISLSQLLNRFCFNAFQSRRKASDQSFKSPHHNFVISVHCLHNDLYQREGRILSRFVSSQVGEKTVFPRISWQKISR